MTSEAQKRASQKYRERTRRIYTLDLNAEKDQDVIEWLDQQENKRQAVMTLIRAEIKEPTVGHWLPYEFGNDNWHKCSACGVADKYIEDVLRNDGTIYKLESRREYCPHCGAKMLQ